MFHRLMAKAAVVVSLGAAVLMHPAQASAKAAPFFGCGFCDTGHATCGSGTGLAAECDDQCGGSGDLIACWDAPNSSCSGDRYVDCDYHIS